MLALRYSLARAFERAIGAENEEHIFVTFDDRKSESESKRPELVSSQRGTLLTQWDMLDTLNRQGAGVFVMLNRGTGKIAKDRIVTGIRAVFADFDPPETAACPATFPLKPSLIVTTSPARHHVYWRAHDVPVSEFPLLQLAIFNRFNSDRSVHNPARLARLPGFYHQKDPMNPFLVHIQQSSDVAYDVETLNHAFPSATPPLASGASGHTTSRQAHRSDEWLQSMLAGEDLHDSALRLVGRFVAQGLDNATIHTLFAIWEPRLREVRDPQRVAELYQGGELARMIRGARQKDFARVSSEDEQDYVAPLPSVDPAIYHGIIGEYAHAATAGREINPIASALAALSWLSAQIGRDLYVPIGDMDHPLLLFTLHIGRSSLAAKNEATALLKKVHPKLLALGLGSDYETRGVSTPEGLIYRLRDGDGEDDPGVEDKRLWLVISEFAQLLGVSQRTGNPLTEMLRDLFDGHSQGPLTKNARYQCTDPHVSIHAAITPDELHKVLRAVDLYNGFLNRFLLSFSERVCLQPLPPPTDPKVVDEIADRFGSVLHWAKGGYPTAKHTRAMTLTPRAEARWREAYVELARPSEDEPLASLLARRAPIARRVAANYAAADRALKVDLPHLEAALAWAEHHRQTAEFVFGGDVKNRESEALQRNRKMQLLAFLREQSPAGVLRSDITTKCFSNHIRKNDLDKLLGRLLADRQIERLTVPHHGAAKKTLTSYRFIGD
ncbi:MULTISPECIES: DUF3987 domain-containing protein [Thiorhodovibrio]|uniref:DUF3987 domain-containing protein n=1 Tax=Thiorhodovibrio TaxID=61593 RepID=UPI0019122587|nr:MULTISPECIES: DUF3987 domain-containing protein [Thiorhodovibrio]